MALPPRSCFQFFGLDYLVDDAMKPWLLEVNATPSMKVGGWGQEHQSGVRMGIKMLCVCMSNTCIGSSARLAVGGHWSS